MPSVAAVYSGEPDLHGVGSGRHGGVEARQADLGGLLRLVVGEGDVLGRQGGAIGELDVRADLEGPHQAVGAHLVAGRHVVDDLVLLIRGQKRAVEEQHPRLTEALDRVEWGLDRGRIHGDHDFLAVREPLGERNALGSRGAVLRRAAR